MTTTQAESIAYATKLEAEECGSCGMPFGLPDTFIRARKRDGKWFWCPNGHEIRYGIENEIDRLKQQAERDRATIKRSQQMLEAARASRDDARRAQEHAERSAAAHKGHATRVKKRVSNGTCPCCNRYFKDLHRHMQSQHPAFAPEAAIDE